MIDVLRKIRVQAPDGRMATITMPRKLTQESCVRVIDYTGRVISLFYYPLLECCSYILADIGGSLYGAGIMRQKNKFYFKQADKELWLVSARTSMLFRSNELLRCYSDAVWDDACEVFRKLDISAWTAVGRVRKGKDVRVISRLLLLNKVAEAARTLLEYIFSNTLKATGIGLADYYAYMSPKSLKKILSMWLDTFADVEKACEAIRNNAAAKTGFDAFLLMFSVSGNINKWHRKAYESLPDELRHKWRPSSERPDDNRRIIILFIDHTEACLYHDGMVTDAAGITTKWDTSGKKAWCYEGEPLVSYDDFGKIGM